jgi:metallophosphoesterase (TIGR00282 family)
LTQSQINILFIADIIGKPGLAIIKKSLKSIREKYQVDFCIANGENGAAGKGLTEDVAAEYLNNGVDLVTSGNHIFEKFGYFKFLNTNHRVLRPLNYPIGTCGKGSTIVSFSLDIKIGVINIQGRTFMQPIDCPFRTISEELAKMRKITPIIIVDFHAEATAEKVAMAWHLNGKVSALIGTHTHIQTADETIMNNGTAYITDVGMTGPYDSVIGMKKEVAMKRFIQQMPERYQPADADSDLRFAGVVVTINSQSGKAESIERLLIAINNEGNAR